MSEQSVGPDGVHAGVAQGLGKLVDFWGRRRLCAVARTTSVVWFLTQNQTTFGHAPRHPSRTTRPTSRGPNITTRPTSMMASIILVKKKRASIAPPSTVQCF